MIIVNADDWGRSKPETDAALSCYLAKRITSASGMVFMEDSKRAAGLANDAGLDVGLHLNLSQQFSGECRDNRLLEYHDQIVRFITKHKYASLLYNPALRHQFRYVYQAQLDEFVNLYEKLPSHIDGHQHKHLCANMLFDYVISDGEKVRRNLSFRPGEKGVLNRVYRNFVDQWLSRRYQLTDFFFDICGDRFMHSAELSHGATVEIMAHPARTEDYSYLMGDDYFNIISRESLGAYSSP